MKDRILVIMPKYFGYEKHIKRILEDQFDVVMIYENMDEVSIFYRFVYVYLKKAKDAIMTRYYKKNITGGFDVVFVIRGASLTADAMEYIKKTSPDAKYIMYQWDSVSYNEKALEIAKYFDKLATFDEGDAKELGWEYRPLFYVSQSERNQVRKNDICFIGSLHSQRVKIYNYIKTSDLKSFMYLYSPITHFIKQKYLKRRKEFAEMSNKEIKTISISLEETQRVYADSDMVVDYTRDDQRGYTIRTIESIGHKCKLVTNNKKIRNADFYNEKNVYIYDINDLYIPDSFVKGEYEMLEESIYEKYSLKCFLRELLS